VGTTTVRIGIAGCGLAAGILLDPLLARDEVEIVGCADPEPSAARAPADRAAARASSHSAAISSFTDHGEPLRQLGPDALANFTPHLTHSRLAMDALQAGCHVSIEKPLSTTVQEAADIRIGPGPQGQGQGGPPVPAGSQPAQGKAPTGQRLDRAAATRNRDSRPSQADHEAIAKAAATRQVVRLI
jgi:hypothetical protein